MLDRTRPIRLFVCGLIVCLAAVSAHAQMPKRFRVRGWVTGLKMAETAQVKLEGPRKYTVTTRPGGRWEHPHVVEGSYIATVELEGYIFRPPQRRFRVVSTQVNGINFQAILPHKASGASSSYGMAGRIHGLGKRRVDVWADGPKLVKTRTRNWGRFNIGKLPAGTYRVTPRSKRYDFEPPHRDVDLKSGHVVGISFRALAREKPRVHAPKPPSRSNMSGRVQGLEDGHFARIHAQNLKTKHTHQARTDSEGRWVFKGLEPGPYMVTAVISEPELYSGGNVAQRVLLRENTKGVLFKVELIEP